MGGWGLVLETPVGGGPGAGVSKTRPQPPEGRNTRKATALVARQSWIDGLVRVAGAESSTPRSSTLRPEDRGILPQPPGRLYQSIQDGHPTGMSAATAGAETHPGRAGGRRRAAAVEG